MMSIIGFATFSLLRAELRAVVLPGILVLQLLFPGTTQATCRFHGQIIKEGQSVVAFNDAYVPVGKSCESQTRACRGGKLAGGYFQPACKAVPFVKPADSRPFKRSDVMFTVRLVKHYYNQPWFDLFNDFQANRIVWTYAGEELLQDSRVNGKIPVQCALEYWVPANHPQREQMSCPIKNAAGRSVGFAEHPVYKLRVPDTNTKAWRDFAYAKAKELVFLGCRSFVQDVPAIMAITRNTRSFIGDGCHSEDSEILYNRYKHEHPGATYAEFMKYSVTEYHQWLHRNIRTAASNYGDNESIYFSANTSAASPAHLEEDGWFFPSFDFLQGEVFGDFSHNSPSKTVTEMVRYLNAKKSSVHPVVLTLRSDSTKRDNITYLRRATMSTYSFGMVPMIPWTASALTDNPLVYFFGSPRDFADIYQTVRSWPKAFDNFEPGENAQTIVPGKTYNASQSMRASSDDILVIARSHVGGGSFRAIYVVNWGAESRETWIELKKSEYPKRPNMILRVGELKPIPISARENGEYYRYSFPALPDWAILFYGE